MKKKLKVIVVCYLLCAFAVEGQNSQKALKLSLLQLIAVPEKFDQKLVSVQGFLEMSREGDLLYLGREDSENMISHNAIWVRRTEQTGRNRATLNESYVTVVGKFDANFKEHWGDPTGGISDVEDVKVWSNPEHPISQRIKEMPGVDARP